MNVDDLKTIIKKAIEEEVFISQDAKDIAIEPNTSVYKNRWIFDFRNITTNAKTLDILGNLFWETFKDRYPFQIGTLEVSGVPLMTAFIGKVFSSGETDATGFFIRKSRKKDGLTKMIEGTVIPNRPIILVDDVLNSGNSMRRQVTVLEDLGHEVSDLWVILRYQDISHYKYFLDKGITIHSLFTLDDFSESLEISNISMHQIPTPPLPLTPFKTHWKFSSENPSHHLLTPKSDPVIDTSKVYFGDDNGIFWSINQTDGSVAWSMKIGLHPKGKGILSSPALWNSTVFFGGYDGNVYALDTQSGKAKWVHFGGDWIGSSPALAPDLNILFIGLEFGLIKKRGGIIAINMETGKRVWKYSDMPCYTHSSPLYIQKHKQVIIGSNDGAAYLFNAKNGDLVWKFETGTTTPKELLSGFSQLDIKESFAYDEASDMLVFGTMAGSLFFVKRKTGEKVYEFRAQAGFTSTPCIYNGKVYATSLDKNLYCLDLNSGKEIWKWNAGARIFASPAIIEGSLYIGSNTGRFTELDLETGREISFAMVTERITNKPSFNKKTKRFFIPTYANEIYCMERKESSQDKKP